MSINENGFEVFDQTPIETPTRLRMPIGHVERMRAVVRQELSRAAQDWGDETFEEADDFDLPDDEQYVSPYELQFEPTVVFESTDASSPVDNAGGVTEASTAEASSSDGKSA